MSDPTAFVISTLRYEVAQARAASFAGDDAAVIARLTAALASGAPRTDGAAELLHAQGLALRTLSLSRLSRFAEALADYRDVPSGAGGGEHAEARAMMLADMAYLCIALEMPQDGLRLADAAFRLALDIRLPGIESGALALVSFCQATGGHLEEAERFLLEGLGLALQAGDDAVIHARLADLLLLSNLLFDAAQSRGDAEGAARVMRRCARLVSQGERLAPRVGLHEGCVWRAHRAGWLRRRGRHEQARADFDQVLEEASAHGWVTLVRSARLEFARVLQDEGENEAAVRMLQAMLAAGPIDDGYHFGLRAHRRLEKLLTQLDRPDDAAQHAAAYRQLLDRRDGNRATAEAALPRWSASVLDALAEADRVRIDAEAERLRAEEARASNREFLATDWAPPTV